MEQEALDYFRKIDAMGGMVAAIEKGFPQREIQDSAYQYQKAVERGEQVIVGVNKYAMTDEPSEVPILVIDESVRTHQVERLEQTRTRRDAGAVANALEKLKARRAQKREHDARDDRSCSRLRNARRNLLGLERRLRNLRRARFLIRNLCPLERLEFLSRNPGSTVMTGAPKSSRARCVMRAWK